MIRLVKFVKTLPEYEAEIVSLHKKLHQRSGMVNFFGYFFCGTYCKGLSDRICSLYRELKRKKEIEQEIKQRQNQLDSIYRQKLKKATQGSLQVAERTRAFEKTYQQPNNRIYRSVSIDTIVIERAREYGITSKDLTSGCMNAYEYQLHKEFVTQLEHLTTLMDDYVVSKNKNIICDALGHSIALGIGANREHEPVFTTRLVDFGWELLEVAKGIVEGVGLGAYNTACFVKNVLCYPATNSEGVCAWYWRACLCRCMYSWRMCKNSMVHG